ncbi:unnamed protein product [Arabis nemorensis]|uniref:Uncharacterized protein n=1 Tax=Arabis nemorensis TaxID=586526 RepID=A0A565CS16_9BRAS|nr:unnamed protein product [Arabis nemorensis]
MSARGGARAASGGFGGSGGGGGLAFGRSVVSQSREGGAEVVGQRARGSTRAKPGGGGMELGGLPFSGEDTPASEKGDLFLAQIVRSKTPATQSLRR